MVIYFNRVGSDSNMKEDQSGDENNDDSSLDIRDVEGSFGSDEIRKFRAEKC
jgi:hypothetical protein